MAITTLEVGWGDCLIRSIVDANWADIVTQDAGTTFTATSFASVGGKDLTEFREITNANLAVADAALSISTTDLEGGETWETMASKMNTNFALIDAAVPVS